MKASSMKRLVAAAPLLLAACASIPTGPSIMALPGTGRTFDQFRIDDSGCRQYAYEQIGGQTANRAAEESGVKSAAVGTALGAAAGAAMDGGSGAAVGAGVGLLMGSAIGTGYADQSAYGAQTRYDNAYVQCMYAQGHRVPVRGNFVTAPAPSPAAAPASRPAAQQPYYPPPPPSVSQNAPPPPPAPGYSVPPPRNAPPPQ